MLHGVMLAALFSCFLKPVLSYNQTCSAEVVYTILGHVVSHIHVTCTSTLETAHAACEIYRTDDDGAMLKLNTSKLVQITPKGYSDSMTCSSNISLSALGSGYHELHVVAGGEEHELVTSIEITGQGIMDTEPQLVSPNMSTSCESKENLYSETPLYSYIHVDCLQHFPGGNCSFFYTTNGSRLFRLARSESRADSLQGFHVVCESNISPRDIGRDMAIYGRILDLMPGVDLPQMTLMIIELSSPTTPTTPTTTTTPTTPTTTTTPTTPTTTTTPTTPTTTTTTTTTTTATTSTTTATTTTHTASLDFTDDTHNQTCSSNLVYTTDGTLRYVNVSCTAILRSVSAVCEMYKKNQKQAPTELDTLKQVDINPKGFTDIERCYSNVSITTLGFGFHELFVSDSGGHLVLIIIIQSTAAGYSFGLPEVSSDCMHINHLNSPLTLIEIHCYMARATKNCTFYYTTNESLPVALQNVEGSGTWSPFTVKCSSNILLGTIGEGIHWVYGRIFALSEDASSVPLTLATEDNITIFLPDSVTCSTKEDKHEKDHLIETIRITCFSPKIFPEGDCAFFEANESYVENLRQLPINVSVTSHLYSSSLGPLYSTTCETSIPKPKSGSSRHIVYGKMFPNVEGLDKLLRPVEIVLQDDITEHIAGVTPKSSLPIIQWDRQTLLVLILLLLGFCFLCIFAASFVARDKYLYDQDEDAGVTTEVAALNTRTVQGVRERQTKSKARLIEQLTSVTEISTSESEDEDEDESSISSVLSTSYKPSHQDIDSTNSPSFH